LPSALMIDRYESLIRALISGLAIGSRHRAPETMAAYPWGTGLLDSSSGFQGRRGPPQSLRANMLTPVPRLAAEVPRSGRKRVRPRIGIAIGLRLRPFIRPLQPTIPTADQARKGRGRRPACSVGRGQGI